MKVITTLILSAICLITASVYAETTTSPDNSVVGNYKCKRTDATSYTVNYPLSITKTGDTYTLEWSDSDGNPVMYGTGVINPNMTNVLTSSYWNIANTDTGVESFAINTDGSLKANWLAQSGKNSGTETCTK
jgi:hypothetical protein